ncbi:MAG: hypothetical protein ACI4J7_08830 [Ruminiclostridium sp.]
MIEIKSVEKVIDKYMSKYSKAFENYQVTGDSRYYRTYIEAELIIEALRMAISVIDIKRDAIYAEGEIASWAGKLSNIDSKDEADKKEILTQIVKEILSAESLISLRHKCR